MRLNRKFDIILSLWGVISYAKTYSNLEKTIKNFSEHLKKGGILIADPWYTLLGSNGKTEPYYKDGMPYVTIYDGPELKIVRARIPRTVGYKQIMDINTLIAQKGNKKIRCFVDRYVVGLFEIKRVLEIMETVGVRAWFEKDLIGNGTYVGIKN